MALALALTACGDDGDDTGADSTEAESDDTGAEDPAGDLSGLLLAPADVGEGFSDVGYQPSTEPGPCGGTLDAELPYEDIVGTVLAAEERELFLQREIRTHADEAGAAEVLAAAQDEFSCGADSTVPGVVLGEVTDASADVGAEAAFVVVQVGPVLSMHQLQGPSASDEGPDPVAIVSANVAALQAELG